MSNKNKIATGVSWSVMERLLTQSIEMVISILLARFLFPEDYGLISLVQIFITISTIFVENGLGTSYIRAKECDEEQTSTLFYFNIVAGIVFYAILYFSAPIIASLKGKSELVLLTRVLALKVPISSIYSMQHAYVKKRMEFKKFFFSSLTGTIVAGVVGVLMAFNGFGVWALVANTLIDQIMDCVILYFTTKWFPKIKINIKRTIDLIKFGLKVFISEFVNRLFIQIKPLVIGLKFTVADLALNSKGLKFAYVPISLISSSISRVMLPVFSQLQDEKEELLELAKKSIRTLHFVLTPLLIGLASISPTLIPFLLTEKWAGAAIYVQIYCLSYLFSPFDLIDRRLLEARGRIEMLIKNNTIGIITEAIIIIICITILDNPIAVSISVLVASILRFVYLATFCKKDLDFGVIGQLKCMVPSLIAGVIMGALVLSLNSLNINIVAKLAIQIFSGATIYFLISYILKNQIFLEFVSKIKKKIS